MGMDPLASTKDQVAEFIRRWDDFPVAPERRAGAPWSENSVEGDDINLFDLLPLFRLNDGGAGFYLDKAAVVSRDPAEPDDFDK
jgi:UbiD family decarboxylase